MGLKVTQDTFNKAVQENINDLGMDPNEAVEEAYKQFQAQGADLSLISKNPENLADKSAEIVSLIKSINDTKKDVAAQIVHIRKLKSICDEHLSNKVTAAKNGAYASLLDVLSGGLNTNNELVIESLRCMVSLTNKNPDVLDDAGLDLIFALLMDNELTIKKLTLKWIKECCVMHELNRQAFIDRKIINIAKPLLESDNPELQREVMNVLRALVLDDDVRVEFSRSHEHARVIASETLCLLTMLMGNHSDDKLISDLMLTITALMVRSEFCKKVEGAGGLDLIKRAMFEYLKSEKINRQCFKLIKALAGDDDVKANIVQQAKLAPSIIEAINNHKSSVPTVVAGLSAIAAITLRSPQNSNTIYEAGAPELIVNVMRLYPKNKDVQKSASWAIRNMVSRSHYQCPAFISLGVEDILQNDLQQFKECEYDFKAALRDLGCKVKLNEEWTGKGGALNIKTLTLDEDEK